MCAGEIFNVALESFVHRLSLTFLPCLIRSNVRFRLGDAVAARSKSQKLPHQVHPQLPELRALISLYQTYSGSIFGSGS